MTTHYAKLRENIKAALNTAGVATSHIYYRRDMIPDGYPAAMIILEGDHGENPSKRQYNSTRLEVAVYLIIDIVDIADPDIAIVAIKEAFRDAYKSVVEKDVAECEYFDASTNSDKVRIAKVKVEYVCE